MYKVGDKVTLILVEPVDIRRGFRKGDECTILSIDNKTYLGALYEVENADGKWGHVWSAQITKEKDGVDRE